MRFNRVHVALALVLGGVSGCHRLGGYEKLIPPVAGARDALEAAMQAWQDGRPVDELIDCSPAVRVGDTSRRPGQVLRSFEILGEVAGDSPRCFVVRLTLDQPAEQVEARYVVFGADPLWVWRHDDLEMITHWDSCLPMSKQAPRAGSSGLAGTR